MGMFHKINGDTIKALILLGVMLLPASLAGQIIIASGVNMSASENTDIIIQAPSDITNFSSYDFAATRLRINLIGADQQITGPFVIGDLSIDGGGVKRVNSAMTVT